MYFPSNFILSGTIFWTDCGRNSWNDDLMTLTWLIEYSVGPGTILITFAALSLLECWSGERGPCYLSILFYFLEQIMSAGSWELKAGSTLTYVLSSLFNLRTLIILPMLCGATLILVKAVKRIIYSHGQWYVNVLILLRASPKCGVFGKSWGLNRSGLFHQR